MINPTTIRQCYGLSCQRTVPSPGGARRPPWSPSLSSRPGVTPRAACTNPTLRRSEAAALRWVDVEFRREGSARVTVRRSKGDQDGARVTLYIGRAAAADLQEIHRAGASPEARVFGLRSGRAVSNRIAWPRRPRGWSAASRDIRRAVGMARDLVAFGRGTRRRPGCRTLDLRPDACPLRPWRTSLEGKPWPGSTGRTRTVGSMAAGEREAPR